MGVSQAVLYCRFGYTICSSLNLFLYSTKLCTTIVSLRFYTAVVRKDVTDHQKITKLNLLLPDMFLQTENAP